jgi:hypothetical protein
MKALLLLLLKRPRRYVVLRGGTCRSRRGQRKRRESRRHSAIVCNHCANAALPWIERNGWRWHVARRSHGSQTRRRQRSHVDANLIRAPRIPSALIVAAAAAIHVCHSLRMHIGRALSILNGGNASNIAAAIERQIDALPFRRSLKFLFDLLTLRRFFFCSLVGYARHAQHLHVHRRTMFNGIGNLIYIELVHFPRVIQERRESQQSTWTFRTLEMLGALMFDQRCLIFKYTFAIITIDLLLFLFATTSSLWHNKSL